MNTGQLSSATLLMQSLGWALLHSLWQGALIFGFLWCMLKALKNTSATIKCYLSLVSFAGMAVWFIDTWVNQWQRLQAVTVYITQAGITKTYAVSTLPAGTLQGTLLHSVLPQLSLYIPFIVGIYMLGLLFMLLRFGVNIFEVRTLRSTGITQPGAQWQELLSRRVNDFNITRHIRLYFSNRVQTPVMIGILKPVILFPLTTISHLSMEQVEAILLHELAHIKRHDYMVNVLQNIVEAILFFNPFVWLISGIIRKEREHCCDDLVIACTAQPLPYAKALAMLEAHRMDTNTMMLAAAGQKNQLFHRIKRIMEMKKNTTNNSQLLIVLLAIVAVAITVTCFTPSYAQKKNNQDGTDTTKSKTVIRQEEKITIIDDNGNIHTYHSMDDVPQKDKDKLKNADGNVISTNHKKVVIINDDADDNNSNTYTDANGKNKVVIIKKHDNEIVDDNSGSNADLSKMIQEITKVSLNAADSAMKQIDWAEVTKSINEAKTEVSNVDWNAIEAEINNSLKDVNAEMKRPHKEMQEDIEKGLESSKEELERASMEIKKEMDQAKQSSNAYTYNSNSYDNMLARMAEDGLIDRSGKYKIKKTGEGLYINGNRQPQAVFDKYNHYMEDDGEVTIKGNGKDISINRVSK